jgi:uncharacterized protein
LPWLSPLQIVRYFWMMLKHVAERLEIRRIGTLGILRKAKKAGLIVEIKAYIEQLRINGIYIRPSLIDAVLRDVGEIDF